jgi:hypothetical protein
MYSSLCPLQRIFPAPITHVQPSAKKSNCRRNKRKGLSALRSKIFLAVSVDQDTSLQRKEGLLNTATGRTGSLAEDKLCAEVPCLRNVPGLSYGLVDGWVQVLEVAAETLSAESGPGNVLVHAVGVFVPCKEIYELVELKLIVMMNLHSGWLSLTLWR